MPTAITTEANEIAAQRSRVRMRSSEGRGFRCITSESGLSRPRAMAGGPSMMRLTHSTAMAAKGLPPAIPVIDAARNSIAKPSVVLSWNRTNFTMLS